MKKGKKVKIVGSGTGRDGSIGTVVGTEMTVFGMMLKVRFEDGTGSGLLDDKYCKVIEDSK